MKKFITKFFTVIGVIVTLMIALVITLAIRQQHSKAGSLPDAMVLSLRIEHSLYEMPEPASLFNPFERTPMTVQQIVQSLDQATHDPHVKAFVLDLKAGQYGLAQLQEIRDAVARFRQSGKMTLLYADTLGDSPAMGSYYLASAFEQIWLQPIGDLAITGVSAEMPFGRNLLDKVGVTPQILHRGAYKSYPEMMDRTGMSDANREMMTSLLDDIYSNSVKTIAQARNLSEKQVTDFVNQAPLSAEQALIGGLIDSVGYADEVDAYLEQRTQGAQSVALEDYAQHGDENTQHKPAYIAYITIEGTLMDVDAEDGLFGSGVASAAAAAEAITDAADHPHIRAILIRVNSPGGSPIAAEIIRRSIVMATARKPVIISMGDSAASGGYWLSAPASAIVAQPATLTGSIGVFGGKIALDRLWDKLGVNWQAVSFGDHSGIWSTNRPYNDSERRVIEASLDRTYDSFITRVAKGRHLPEASVRKIAQGRVWTGRQAVSLGLVDALGGVDKAVSLTRLKLNIPASQPVQMVPFPEQESPVAQLFKIMRRRLGGAEARTPMVTLIQSASALTGLPLNDTAALLQPQSLSTYSFVRVY